MPGFTFDRTDQRTPQGDLLAQIDRPALGTRPASRLCVAADRRHLIVSHWEQGRGGRYEPLRAVAVLPGEVAAVVAALEDGAEMLVRGGGRA